MPETMKKVGMKISICMGITLSFCLSLVGTLMGQIQQGGFSVAKWLPGFLISFIISLVISLVIGFVVPMGKISKSVHQKHGDTMRARCVESLYSDLIYTPIITIIMVIYAYFMTTSHGGDMALVPALISSLIVCMIVGYILIFIFQPLYMKTFMKKAADKEKAH